MTHLLTQLELMPSFLEGHVSNKSRSKYTSLAKKRVQLDSHKTKEFS